MPVEVPRMPRPRLKWPVPRVRSATTSGTITARTAAVTPSSSCTASKQRRIASPRQRAGRGSAARRSRSAATGGGPRSARAVPTHGDSAATTSCGTTMQAAMRSVAQRAERMVTTLPINGSMAALARWNRSRQPAKMSSGRLCISAPGLTVAGVICGGRPRPIRRRRGGAPWARSGSISLRAIERSAISAGTSRQHGDDENGARGNQIPAGAHRGRRQAVADRGKAGVASEPFADRGVADQAEADRRHGRAEHAAGERMQHRSRQHHGKDRPRGIAEGACANRRHRNAGDKALRAGGIDQRAAGHLPDQRDETGRRQNEPDIDLGPSLRGEIDRDERSESGLHVGDEENEPIEPAQAPPRRRRAAARSPAGGSAGDGSVSCVVRPPVA